MTVRDSPAEVVSAVIYFVTMTLALLWAAFKVISLAKRSFNMHKDPAYILYSDPDALNKWGFFYVRFRARAYYFTLAVLGHIIIKALFIALAQNNAVVQAVALFVIESLWLVCISIFRPWIDKRTNFFNISIGVINFFNSITLLFFSNIFNQPVRSTYLSKIPLPLQQSSRSISNRI